MLQAMHASNARKQCRYETNVTNGLRSGLSCRDLLTFRNARAHMRQFPLELGQGAHRRPGGDGMKPYYEDDTVTLYHGDCREYLGSLPDRSVDCVITDPPYSERTHRNATTNKAGEKDHPLRSGGDRSFASITEEQLRADLTELGRVSRGWVVATLDYRHAVAFDADPPEGLRVLRLGVWVKTNPTPQISGDRPAQGWESIAYMHRADVRPAWSGGGSHGNHVSPLPPSEGHPTAKPLPLVAKWVRWFTKPGDLILDPFAGSGTTGRAAVDEGRRAVLWEGREDYCRLIAKRLAQGVLDFGSAS